MTVVQHKIEGVAPSMPAAVAQKPGKVVDLMEILKMSLKETRKKTEPEAVAHPVQEETVTVGSPGASKPKTRKAR